MFSWYCLLVQDFFSRSSNSCQGIVINLRPRRLLFVNVLDLVYRIAAIKRSWYSRFPRRNRFRSLRYTTCNIIFRTIQCSTFGTLYKKWIDSSALLGTSMNQRIADAFRFETVATGVSPPLPNGMSVPDPCRWSNWKWANSDGFRQSYFKNLPPNQATVAFLNG